MGASGLLDWDSANKVTWNPGVKGSAISLSNHNLTATVTTGNSVVYATVGKNAGKWYWENLITGTSTVYGVGIGNSNIGAGGLANYIGAVSATIGYVNFISVANKVNNGTPTPYGATYATGDIIAVALDLSGGTGTVTFYKNNVSQGAAFSGLSLLLHWYPCVGSYLSNPCAYQTNFGATAFAFAPPTGFIALTP